MTAVIVILVTVILLWRFFSRYRLFKNAALDYRLKNARITKQLRSMAKSTPTQYPTNNDWKQLRFLVEHEIPAFHDIVNPDATPLTEMEYDICLLTRVHILPTEIAKLKQCDLKRH